MPSRSNSSRRHSNQRKDKKQRKNSSRSHSSRSNSSRRSSPSSSKERKPAHHRDIEKVEPSAKLFVTNIDSKYTQDQLNKQLRDVFVPFGAIKDIVIKTKAGSTNSYCFIEYQNVDDAKKAQEELKGKEFKGKELKVQFGRGQRKAEDRRSDKCYICHKQGHFAKDCKFNKFNDRRYDDRYRRDGRDRDRHYQRDRDRDYDRRDRRYRDHKDYRDRGQRKHRKSYSSSRSSRSSYDRKRGRHDDYRRHRDSHRSPEKRRHYRQNSRRYD